MWNKPALEEWRMGCVSRSMNPGEEGCRTPEQQGHKLFGCAWVYV